MYYRLSLLAEDRIEMPGPSHFIDANAAVLRLFETAEDNVVYEMVEKYVRDAFDTEDFELLVQNIQTFAKRSDQDEFERLMQLLADDHWKTIQEKGFQALPAEATENASGYWYLTNIMGGARPDRVQPKEALRIQFEVEGNGEDPLFTADDTGRYGDLYPFAVRALLDASAAEGKIGDYELTGPLVTYFEKLKESEKTALPSNEPFDFGSFGDDAYGVVFGAQLIHGPADNADGVETAIYEFIVDPNWLAGPLKKECQTYAFSEFGE
ncbi:hypothetical protein [Saprospira grandis]|uniref:Uncharacterized protein n=1 Tax=Saprospira grandis (strain Lewin) TaxID=984262 RepID=H6L0E5_SAPGL|nr:hypothetical protein [Saprospira grandis]AFC23375.1 hypothetical protein SGRA_0636 [Saprospira grandis str. Lewin]